MKPVIILGAGGHAKVLIDVLLLLEREIIGIIDPQKEAGSNFSGFKILGNDETLSNYSKNDIELINGVGSIPGTNTRWQIAEEMSQKGFKFSQIIHPTAVISGNVSLGPGIQVMAGAIIQPGTQIESSCIINTGAIIDHDCTIGKNCHIAPGVTLSGNVTVGENTHIGTGASVIQGITIGNNCVIAAGSIIYKNVPPETRIIQTR